MLSCWSSSCSTLTCCSARTRREARSTALAVAVKRVAAAECAPRLKRAPRLTCCLRCAADVECCVNIACHLVPRVAATGQAAADAAVDAVLTALTAKARCALAVTHLPATFAARLLQHACMSRQLLLLGCKSLFLTW